MASKAEKNGGTKVKLGDKIERWWKFATEDVWDIELGSLSSLRRMWVSLVRIITLIIKGYKEDECSIHASSLTFSTLMAIVPILALSLALARGLGDPDSARNWVEARVYSWTASFKASPAATTENAEVAEKSGDAVDKTTEQEVQNQLAARINSVVEAGFKKVDEINFAKLSAVGVVLLFWMVISVLSRVESSFNRVWGVTRGRTLWRCFTDYLSVLLVLPVLLAAAASLPVMSLVTKVLSDGTSEFVQGVVHSGVFKNLTVLGMTTLTFAFLIMFMPNTRVKLKAGLSGGLVTAILFLFWMAACAWLQVGVARTSKIYGSFAIVPILLAWVHVSWEIVLFGAEVAFAVQHFDTYKMEQRSNRANLNARVALALVLLSDAARAMLKGTPPLNLAEYTRRYKIPIRFLNAVVDVLIHTGYLGPLGGKEDTYVLLRSPSKVNVGDITGVMVKAGVGPDALGISKVAPRVSKLLATHPLSFGKDVEKRTIESLLA